MSAARQFVPTRCGLLASITRRVEFWSVSMTLKWGEEDRALLARQVERLPGQLAQLDNDLAALRVRQALLRSGR